jgi:SWI/SNF-related matrix-associated actin-dependent regulator 1 of chromatin subfamily A
MNDLMNLLGEIDELSKPKVLDDGFLPYSDKQETDFVPISLPQEITLRGYQMAAVETILKFKRGILGFAPGMGKTPTALTAIENLGGKTVIIIPPSLAYDPWKKEIEKLFPWTNFVILQGQKSDPIPDDVEVVICGDSIVSHRKNDILAWQPNTLVVDEAQRHKNRKAKRAEATSDIANFVRQQKGGTVILMTGTLATNNAEEVWMPAQIAGIAEPIVGSSSYNKWCNTWCYMQDMMVEKKVGPKKDDKKSIWIKIPNGCKDPMGLHDALRSTAYIRVEREDVLDMPDKLFVEHGVHVQPSALKEYNLILNDFHSWITETGGPEAAERVSGSEKLVQLGKLVEHAALAKVDDAAEYVAALVEQQEQVVVMAHHKSVVAAFKAALDKLKISSVTFTGNDSPQQKANNIDTFKSGEVPVLIGNIQSAGTGLNLENSANLVFIQLPWSPSEFEQASDRIYRVTQKRECTIHTLYTANTVEEHVMDVLNKKAIITNAINAGTMASGSTDDSFVDEVFEMML